MNENWFVVIVFTVIYAAVFVGVLVFSEFRYHRCWKAAFLGAFKEWSSSCDWEGYDEIPVSMYEDLAKRLEAAQERGFYYRPGRALAGEKPNVSV